MTLPTGHPAPETIAVIADYDGSTLTYRDLDENANRFARYLCGAGVTRGDVVAVLADNDAHFYEIVAGIERCGGAYAAVNYDLTFEAIRHIVHDARPVVLITTPRQLGVALAATSDLPPGQTQILVVTDKTTATHALPDGLRSYQDAIAAMSTAEVSNPGGGGLLNYTSGSTGLPKPIRYEAGGMVLSNATDELLQLFIGGPGAVYLVPSPVYHNLPGMISALVHSRGGTVVILRDFSPEHVLAAIERYRPTHTMIPPSLLALLSKLPSDVKQRHDTSSLRGVLHDAAPCAPAIKQAMIEWWGPILNEFFGASDVGGFTLITSPEWIDHRGSVGRPLSGVIQIRDVDGTQLPARATGEIWMGTGEKVSGTGDIGYLDDDGYLYHLDRKSNIVPIDGVDVYPEQIEHTLIAHPPVADLAVINTTTNSSPALTAVVQPLHWPPTKGLAEELTAIYAQSPDQAHVPLTIKFVHKLPRAATGKLYRNQITLP